MSKEIIAAEVLSKTLINKDGEQVSFTALIKGELEYAAECLKLKWEITPKGNTDPFKNYEGTCPGVVCFPHVDLKTKTVTLNADQAFERYISIYGLWGCFTKGTK